MSNAKLVAVILLCGLAGAALGTGVMGIVQRNPAAVSRLASSPAVNAAIPANSALAAPDSKPAAQQITVGVGGNFVTEVYKKASPAVVHITNRSVQTDFFMGQYTAESTGSGVIVNDKGYILTNFHVIQDSNQLIVVLNDGREFDAKLLGSDPGTDLALVKIEAPGKLPFVELGTGQLPPG
jgi:S1-C subfamily serine protease